MASTDTLSQQLDRIAALDGGPFPVISLYLNMQPDQHGRDNFDAFLRKELAERVKTYGSSGPEQESLEKDAARIRERVAGVDKASNGLAIFACSGADFFEAVELAVPIDGHRLHVSDQPHLYPLARLLDEYPRFAVLIADTNSARIFVVAANAVEETDAVKGTKTRKNKVGGWSQARYQRHIENYHVHHAKEVVDALARLVQTESVKGIIIAGDEVIVPLLKEQFPKEIADLVIDVVKLDIRAPEKLIVEKTIAAMRDKDAEGDRERVDQLLGAYRGNGLATVGVENTRAALELGQVDQLVITGVPEAITVKGAADADGPTGRSAEERVADDLIVKARQTAATVRFIEDPALLESVGGVGAFLRFKL